MDAVILAGGKGKRLEKLTKNLPKPLLTIGHKSLLEHQIDFLTKAGVKKIWVLSGYLGKKIDKKINGRKWLSKVENIIEDHPLGTALALKQLENLIQRDFLVLSGDVYFDIDISRLYKFHKSKKGSIATLVVHPNDHPFDSDLVEIDKNDKVKSLLIRRNKTHPKNFIFRNLANSGIFVFSAEIFKYIDGKEFADIEKDIIPKVLNSRGAAYAYSTPEYLKDIGTEERLRKVRSDYKHGKPAKLNLKNKRGAVFLDRDGTISKEIDEKKISSSNFRLYSFSSQAIKRINKAGIFAIVVTNQPSIAKGFTTIEEVESVHKKMEAELGRNGAWIDAIYYCPHHPELGFEGEIKTLKIKCSCRKPKTGLFKRAVLNFNIDLSKSYYIGDSTIDAKYAKNAGLKFIGVKTGYGLRDEKYSIDNNLIVKESLLEAVRYISDKS